ncbi:hypothetical protein [Chromobacterium phragmitis]|uniref:HTH cro/C1-type domain-containing protein n=1 Tax=Chromobacterium phragmitis TaxID=2202141 RepID=A0ABV0J0P2_9NEIS
MLSHPVTTLNTITLIILRQLRHEKRIHPAILAQNIGKTLSDLEKIEAGRLQLSFADFMQILVALNTAYGPVIESALQHAALLQRRNWVVLGRVGVIEQDDLMKSADAFWSSEESTIPKPAGFETVLNTFALGTNTGMFGPDNLAPVFKYALESNPTPQDEFGF